MARYNKTISRAKIVATTIGVALCATDCWLSAEMVSRSEGTWLSSLVASVIVAAIGAAAALPFAERAAKQGEWLKSIILTLFFLTMVAFQFSTSVDRVGGKRDTDTASVHSDNQQVKLAQDAYDAAKKTAEAECAKVRGTRCRKAEDAENKAREKLSTKPAERVEDSMAKRLSSVTGLTVENIETYQPLTLPFGLQLGGFALLALGLAPRAKEEPKPKARRKPRKKAAVKPKAKLGNVVDFQTTAKRATK